MADIYDLESAGSENMVQMGGKGAWMMEMKAEEWQGNGAAGEEEEGSWEHVRAFDPPSGGELGQRRSVRSAGSSNGVEAHHVQPDEEARAKEGRQLRHGGSSRSGESQPDGASRSLDIKPSRDNQAAIASPGLPQLEEDYYKDFNEPVALSKASSS